MAAPGVFTAAIFCFILAWNELLFALILTNNQAVTLPVGLALFNAEEGVLWHLLAAAGSDNLLYPMKAALVAGATVGEVSDVLRSQFGEYRP